MILLSPLDTDGKTEQKRFLVSHMTKSGRLLWEAAISMFLFSALFITNVKSMTFLTRSKCFFLKSISQIRSLGKNGIEEDKEEEKLMREMQKESFVTNCGYSSFFFSFPF